MNGSKQGLTLVVGLGNAGKEYKMTKHNIGLLALEYLAAKKYEARFKPKISVAGHVAEVPAKRIVLYWPETFMNICGMNVKLALNKYKVNDNSRLIVLHDCLETKLGVIKTGKTGSFKGHNGLKSISNSLGGAKDFHRIAIGIGRPAERDQSIVSKYVLSPFEEEVFQDVFVRHSFPAIH